MPKRVFWPAVLVTMGLIFMASNMGYLPAQFWSFWPLLLIIVGLGGLLTSDRDEWMSKPGTSNKSVKSSPVKRSATSKKTTKAKSRK
jgi:hypothetical protein